MQDAYSLRCMPQVHGAARLIRERADIQIAAVHLLCVIVGRIGENLVLRLHAEIVKILNMPDIKNPIVEGGYEMGGESAEEFANFVHVQRGMWAKVLKEVNVTSR